MHCFKDASYEPVLLGVRTGCGNSGQLQSPSVPFNSSVKCGNKSFSSVQLLLERQEVR